MTFLCSPPGDPMDPGKMSLDPGVDPGEARTSTASTTANNAYRNEAKIIAHCMHIALLKLI